MANATLRSIEQLDTLQVKMERATTTRDSTYELPATSAAGTEVVFCRIPTRARIHGLSRVQVDDLATTGSPTLDFGFSPVGGNFTKDDDAVNDGINVYSAAATVNLVKDHANSGKMVWELLGLSSDPGGFADLIGTTKDAACDAGGTITVTLVSSVD